MYKWLLCWRYLRTRYLAVISVVSVMLGVATLIVVNSVMSGFSSKLRDRLHGLLCDVVIESPSFAGFPEKPDEMIRRIKESPAGQYVEAVSPTVEVMALLQYRVGATGDLATRPVRLIGVDPKSRAALGGFSEFLVGQKDAAVPTFELTAEMQRRIDFGRRRARSFAALDQVEPPPAQPLRPGQIPPPEVPRFDEMPPDVRAVVEDDDKDRGAIVGHAIAFVRNPQAAADAPDAEKEITILPAGTEIDITTVGAAAERPVRMSFHVRDFFKSGMSEYDSNIVFVPLDFLQRRRVMGGRVTHLQIKLTDFSHAPEVVAGLKRLFPEPQYYVATWQQKQGPLLAAIAIERGLLNVLLFLIVGVAGFSILAIFSMIVFEKTRDIGVMKALGASNRGVMSIFLGYGLLLGVVGVALGTALGLAITAHINDIEQFITHMTGHEVFDRKVYYFSSIPTNVDPLEVILVDLGAVAIAVLFSVLPAMKAAMLHPVRALRYD